MLYVTAGFYEDGENIATVLHIGTREAYNTARSRIRSKAANDQGVEKVADFETQPAEGWLGCGVVECIDIGGF